jgi:hypothetical protein
LWREPSEAWAKVANEIYNIAIHGQPTAQAVRRPASGASQITGERDIALTAKKRQILIVSAWPDSELTNALVAHLAPMAGRRDMQVLDSSSLLKPGPTEWERVVLRAMEESDIVLLMITVNFSNLWGSNILRYAAELESSRRARVWFIRGGSVFFDESEYPFEVLPEGGAAIDTRPNRDEAWLEVCRTLLQNVEREAPVQDRAGPKTPYQPPSPRKFPRPVRVMLVHSPEDTGGVEELEAHLGYFTEAGQISIRRRPTMDSSTRPASLEDADVLVWLVSAHLISEAVDNEELERALFLANDQLPTMLAVRFLACSLEGLSLERVPSLPRSYESVNSAPHRDAAWREVAIGICEACGVLDDASSHAPSS